MDSRVVRMQEYYRKRAPEYDASMKYDQDATAELFRPVFGYLESELAGAHQATKKATEALVAAQKGADAKSSMALATDVL